MGRLVRLERRSLLGLDVGIETQRSLNTFVTLTPQTSGWLRPRASVTSTFTFTRDPNGRQPVREIGDTAGAFRIPAAFANSRRLDVGAQLDPRRLGGKLFGDSARAVGMLERLSSVDLSYGHTRNSSFNRSAFTPSFGYQLALGGREGFRRQGSVLAASAAENTSLQAGGALRLLLGVRLTTSYRRTSGVTWVLRGDQQVPIRTQSREWPSGGLHWSWTPARGHPAGRALTSLTAQLSYRKSESGSQQPALTGAGAASITQSATRTLTPTLTLTWLGGVLTSFDASSERTEQLSAANRFRSVRGQQNATLSFAFKPPASLVRLKTNIRTTARYSVSDNTTCLQPAGQPLCKAYVDSRQTQAQLTMDTEFPPNLSAGLQMAYLVNEERQASRKIAQLVITAFVSLTTTVGQLR